MLTVSPTLAAAIDSPDRPILLPRLRVDWDKDGNYDTTTTIAGAEYSAISVDSSGFFGDQYGDEENEAPPLIGPTRTIPLDNLSEDVDSLEIVQSLESDLPEQVRRFSGAQARQLTAVLAHVDPANEQRHAGWKYSPFSYVGDPRGTSPLVAKEKRGRPIKADVTFAATDPLEWVPQFSGNTTSLEVDGDEREAVLSAVDVFEFGKQVSLPSIAADGFMESGLLRNYALTTHFLVDWVFRQCGYYATPRQRTNCKFMATFHGSAYPEFGGTFLVQGADGDPLNLEPHPTFPFGQVAPYWVSSMGTRSVGTPPSRLTYSLSGQGSSPAGVNNGQTVLIEGAFRNLNRTIDNPLFYIYGGTGPVYCGAFLRASDHKIVFVWDRTGAATGAVAGPVISGDDTAYHYFGVHFAFSSGGVTVNWRIFGPNNNLTGSSGLVAGSGTTGQTNFEFTSLALGRIGGFALDQNAMMYESVQITSETFPVTWNHDFVPSASIGVSQTIDNRILATPPTTEEAWSILRRIADADFATVGKDDNGNMFWRTREWFSTPPQTTPQQVITTKKSLKSTRIRTDVDMVRNRVIVRATMPKVDDPTDIWRLNTAIVKIPAGTTKTITAYLEYPAANIDRTVTYSGDPADGSRYLAGTKRDGSGAQVSSLVFFVSQVAPQRLSISITNPSASTAYLTADADAPTTGGFFGKPFLLINGQSLRFDRAVDIAEERSDSTSIATYSEQVLELSGNPFWQDIDQIAGVAQDILNTLKQAGPVLLDVEVVGDPRRRVGDRYTLQDLDGLSLSTDFHASKIRTTIDAGGLRQTMNFRAVVT